MQQLTSEKLLGKDGIFDNSVIYISRFIRSDGSPGSMGWFLKQPVKSRGVLLFVFTLCHLLGFVSQWMPPGKMLLQRLRKKKIGLDDPNENEDNLSWEKLPTRLEGQVSIKLPGCLFAKDLKLVADGIGLNRRSVYSLVYRRRQL